MRPDVRRVPGTVPARLLLLVTVAALATGCVRMPTSGPVVETGQSVDGRSTSGAVYDYDAPSPTPGASAQEVVLGFLDAMQATPITTNVAAEYLTVEAQERWDPEQGMITYSDLDEPQGELQVSLKLSGGHAYDHRGAWSHALTGRSSWLRFPMTVQDGEWRIDEAPDALVVPESWFADRFERASLHFLDATAQILVPEPVHVPSGDQLATSLVRGLFAGPAPELQNVQRSHVPTGLRAPLWVPISSTGVAEVSLEGATGADVAGLVTEEMVAQLAWTLRQEPRISSIRLTLDGEPLPLPDGAELISMDAGARFDPRGVRASTDVFALRDGLLVSGALDELAPTDGVFGVKRFGLRSLGVSVPGDVAAGVTSQGRSVLVAPVDDPEGQATEVVSGATDLLPPAWDAIGTLWLVDRAAGAARVSVVVENQPRAITVPGLTGERVEDFLVSRDGTRLVAVVHGRKDDRLVVGRVLRDEAGRVLRVSRVEELVLAPDGERRISDIGWRSPTSVAVLSEITDDLSEVRTVAVDGAPADLGAAGATRIRGRGFELVSSPVEGESVYVIGSDGVTDVTDPLRQVPGLDPGIGWIGYVG